MFQDFRNIGKFKFDDERKKRFLEVYSETGRLTFAAECAMVCPNTVRKALKDDTAFAEAFGIARNAYADMYQKEIHRRALEGVEEPVFNFRDNSLAGHVLKFSDRMLELGAKRFEPEYRDKAELDINVHAGVLVVTSPGTVTPEEWANKFNGKDSKK